MITKNKQWSLKLKDTVDRSSTATFSSTLVVDFRFASRMRLLSVKSRRHVRWTTSPGLHVTSSCLSVFALTIPSHPLFVSFTWSDSSTLFLHMAQVSIAVESSYNEVETMLYTLFLFLFYPKWRTIHRKRARNALIVYMWFLFCIAM